MDMPNMKTMSQTTAEQARKMADAVYRTESRRVFATRVRPVQEIAGLPKV
jgi:hypothetical protein